MTVIYATTGDRIAFRLNKQGEQEAYTIEGPRVVTAWLKKDSDFTDQYSAIKTLWPEAVVRFESERKAPSQVKQGT